MERPPRSSPDESAVPAHDRDPVLDADKAVASEKPAAAMNADQLTAVTGVQLMQGIGHRPAEGFWTEAWGQVLKRPAAVASLAWVGLVAFFSVFAPLIASGHPLLLVPASVADAGPLAALLAALPDAAASPDGLRIVLFTGVWMAAWVLAPSKLPSAARLWLGVAATLPFAIRVFGQFIQTANPETQQGLHAASVFILGGEHMAFQILVDIGVAVGLVWAAGTFGLSRPVRAWTAALLPIGAIGALVGAAGAEAEVSSPLIRNLSAVDLALMAGAVGMLLVVLPRWNGTRSGRGRVVLTAALQAGLVLLIYTVAKGFVDARDASDLVRTAQQHPAFEAITAMVIVIAASLPFAFVHPTSNLTRSFGVAALVGVTLFGILAVRWTTPLPNFDYVGREARGEIRAIYAPIPWSPQQGGSAVDLLRPGSNLFGQVEKGVDLELGQATAAAGLELEQRPLDDAVLAEFERQIGFASANLPATTEEAFGAIVSAYDAGEATTIGDAFAVLESLESPGYALGTDSIGQDVLSQMLHACRLSISIGLVSTAIAVAIGVTIGALMGYFGGWVDMLLYRVVEVFMAVPLLFLLIVAAAVLPKNTYVMMAVIGCVTWTGAARFIRAEFYKLRGQDFVQSARAVGLPLRSVLFKHMLPNGVTPVLVDASFAIAAAILAEAILSYLGLGPANQASWGRLLSDATNQVGDFVWWLAIFPGLAIFLTVLSYNLIGEALRDAIDPKLKKARV
ncbi:MAG: ABC transporter permease [Planctomycetota bacterium]